MKKKVIDKKLYKKALQYYQEWNEAELRDRVRNAGKLSPEEGWRRYVSLWEFCMKLSPVRSDWQHEQKLKNLNDYYAHIQKLSRGEKFMEKSLEETLRNLDESYIDDWLEQCRGPG